MIAIIDYGVGNLYSLTSSFKFIGAGIRRVFNENPAAFDPREYLKVARSEVKKMVQHKIKNVLGSSGSLN